jgi:hypothetical protein
MVRERGGWLAVARLESLPETALQPHALLLVSFMPTRNFFLVQASGHAPDVLPWLVGAVVIVLGVVAPLAFSLFKTRNAPALRRD